MASIEKRVLDDGSVRYRVKVRLKGHPTQTATFQRLTDAKKWVQDTESAIRDQRYFKTSASKKHTLGESIDRYIKQVLPQKPKSIEAQLHQLVWWKEHLGSYFLADITTASIVEHKDKLFSTPKKDNKPRSTATVNRYLAALSHVLSVASDEWCWIENNPMRKVSKMKEPRGRTRFLSDTERQALLDACRHSKHSHIYTIVVLALSTGMRQGEILTLTWDSVDFQQNKIILHETKNGERRVVPLVGKALEVLVELKKTRIVGTNLLFPSCKQHNGKVRFPLSYKPMHIRKPWNDALKKAAIDDFRFHDLRHSCASYLAMNGASLAEIAEVLGHKTLQMVKRYAHLSDAHTAGVVERMNNKIFG